MTKYLQAACIALMGATIIGMTACGESEPPPPPPKKPAAPLPKLTVGGSASGIAGNGLVLQLNGANDLAVNANGNFSFPNALAKGTAYSVTIKASPAAPIKQTCTVAQGSGTIAQAPVNNVAVSCVNNTFALGGKVSGLTGKGLVLQLNGSNELAIAKNGPFVFPDVRLPDGSDYSVAIKTLPARQKCDMKSINFAPDDDTLYVVELKCSKKGHRK